MGMLKVAKTLRVKDFRGNEYCVFFHREYEEYWGYMGMRDYMTYEPTDNFSLVISKYVNGEASNVDSGYGTWSTKLFDKEMANRIYLTIEAGMSLENLVSALKKHDLVVREHGRLIK